MLLDTRYVFVYDSLFSDDYYNGIISIFLTFRELLLLLQVILLVPFVIVLETSYLPEILLCVIRWENVLILTQSMFCKVADLTK